MLHLWRCDMKIKNLVLFLILILALYGCGNTTSGSSSNSIHQSDEDSEFTSKSEDSIESLIEECTSIYLCYEYDIVEEGSKGPLYQIDIDKDMAHFMFRGYTSDGYETREADFVLDKFENIRHLIMQSSPSILDVNNYADENGKISGTLNPALEIYCNNHTFILDVEDISEIESAFNKLFDASDITYIDESAVATTDSNDNIDTEYLVDFEVNDGQTMTINLKDSGDGSLHYAVVAISLSLDSSNEDYSSLGNGDLRAYDNIISDTIKTCISGHTVTEMVDNEKAIKTEILSALQSLFKSSFIVKVNFSVATYQ